MNHPNYAIRANSETILLIEDLGPWDRHTTITNAAEFVVEELYRNKQLRHGKHLHYIDSEGVIDEIHHERGKFTGFGPGRTS